MSWNILFGITGLFIVIVQYGQAPMYIMEERDEGIKEKQLRKTKSLWVESRRAYFVFLHESNLTFQVRKLPISIYSRNRTLQWSY